MTVLVQIRDDGLRSDVVHVARAAGYATEEAGTTRDALRHLEAHGAGALVLEVSDGEGLRALDVVREVAPEVAVVAIGAEPGIDRVIDAFRRGAQDFLRKPFDAAALERALVRHLSPTGGPLESEDVLARDRTMLQLLSRLESAAGSDATVRIVGESGTGKETLARRLHRRSARRHGPFTLVSCSGLSPSLAEGELFGRVQDAGDPAAGGPTGGRPGRIRAAAGGTLVLDEVGDLPLDLQPKLLQFLQGREVRPVGAREAAPVDVRVVATTRHDLAALVEAGRFREELFYRLDVITLRIPPLRERPSDVPLLAQAFLERFARLAGEPPARLGSEALERLRGRPFRGNVRELESLMRRAALLFPGRTVEPEHLERPLSGAGPAAALGAATLDLRELEREAIVRALALAGGNRTAASRSLGISVRTLRNKIHRYHLT